MKPASGQIIFDGKDITGRSCDQIVRLGISHCPEGRRVFPRQTVQENLRMGAFVQKDKAVVEEDIKKYYQWFPRLEERKNQKAGLLSGGEQQMLAICPGTDVKTEAAFAGRAFHGSCPSGCRGCIQYHQRDS